MTSPAPNSQLPTPSARTDWRRVAARMQRELDRADLGDRATRLARVLVGVTLAERRVEVLLTDRAELCRLLGIGENHIGGVFDLLAASGIASCARVSEGWLVRVFSDSAAWRCEWHFEREALCAYLSEVNRAPGQVQGELWEPEPDLQRAKAEVDAEKVSIRAEFPKREVKTAPVPVLGTRLAPSSSFKKPPTARTFSLEVLQDLKLQVQSDDEREAMAAMRCILGDDVWEGRTPEQQYPGGSYKDGAKWRLNWRANPDKTRRVFLQMIEDLMHGKPPRRTGGRAHQLWGEFK